MDLMTRRTSFAPPASLDTEARSFSATVATSAPVRRPPPTPDGSPEPWDEVLSLDPRHVDLSRLVGGPLLLGHDQARHLGVITGARIENGVLIADLKLSRRAEADQTLQDIADRVIQQVSAGFTVQSWRRQPSAATGVRRYLAERWTPLEVSVLPLAADGECRIRSYSEEKLMTDTTVSEDTADAGAQASTWSADDVVQLVRSAARLGLSAETAIDLRERGLSLAEARDELINRRAEADEKIMTRAHRTEVGISYDSPDALMSRMTDALLNRLVPAKFDLPEHAREFRGASIADLKARLLSARGVNVRGLTADEILTRGIGGVHTTSDLPQLLSNTLNKSLDQHEADNQTPLKQFSREKSATDFKEMLAVRTGTTSLLQVVHESGEFKRGVFAEEASGFSLKTAGLIWGISRQALVNDDLSALADISDEINTVVAEYEASVLVGLLVGAAGAGAVCGDGVTLFHGASHGNVGTDGVPSVTTLSELRQLLRAQRTIGDKVLAGSTPKAVIAPPALETTFEQLLFGTLSAPNAAAINPFAGALQLYVEPRLTDSERWYVVSGEFLSHAYLQGQRGAQIATREGFDTDGVEIRARLDFGATVRDWRRIAKNDGAAPGA